MLICRRMRSAPPRIPLRITGKRLGRPSECTTSSHRCKCVRNSRLLSYSGPAEGTLSPFCPLKRSTTGFGSGEETICFCGSVSWDCISLTALVTGCQPSTSENTLGKDMDVSYINLLMCRRYAEAGGSALSPKRRTCEETTQE